MTENQRRDPEISRRDAEMCRVEAIQLEMASAVRFLGGEGSAKDQINRAARATNLPHTVVERLRWRKIKRIPADIADTVRDAVAHHKEESLARAKHELFIERQKSAVLAARLMAIDPDRYREEAHLLRRPISGMGSDADLPGGGRL